MPHPPGCVPDLNLRPPGPDLWRPVTLKLSATTQLSLRASLAPLWQPRILLTAKSPWPPDAGQGPGTARRLCRDFPPFSIMWILRCCAAAQRGLTRQGGGWPRRRTKSVHCCAPSPLRRSPTAAVPPPPLRRHAVQRRRCSSEISAGPRMPATWLILSSARHGPYDPSNAGP